MSHPGLAAAIPVSLAALVALVMGGCRADAPNAAGGAGNDASSGPSDAGADGGDLGDGPGPGETLAPGGCVEIPTARRTTGSILELPVDLFLYGKPMVFGEANTLAVGWTLTPLNVRFYISEIALLRAGGDPVAVDLVSAVGVPEPYGVHLFNAEDVASRTLRVLAPPGTYSGISFLFGLTDACNLSNAAERKAPLSPTSQMTWPHTFGYLFLRYEGRIDGAGPSDAGAPPLRAIHMGGQPGVPSTPVIRVEGPLSVPSTGPVSKGLRVVMDEIFKGAATEVDLTGFSGPPTEEVHAGERLRRSLPGLRVFVFTP